MTVALAFETDDGSRAMQTRLAVDALDGVRAADADFAAFYDLARTAAQLRAGGYASIALQFPDSLLRDAPRVQTELQRLLVEDEDAQVDRRIFVLGDTSYGSCCVDEVAAQHLRADCIVHYGRTCLSTTSQVPVVYVFGNAPVDVAHCADALARAVSEQNGDDAARVLVLYEPSYHHASRAIHDALAAALPARRVLLGDMRTFFDPTNADHQREIAVEHGREEAAEGDDRVLFLGGQQIRLRADDPRELSGDHYAIAYVGAESPHLTSILMRHSGVPCVSVDPQSGEARVEGAAVNRALMRRFFLVQQAREAQIIGILMGTLGVSKYLDVVHSLQRLIKQSGRKSYLFVVGKVNVPKLANYAEIDAFVLVACQQNSLMDSKEYFKPIVTPYELQLALSDSDEWSGQLKTDFREVLPLLDGAAKSLAEKQEGGGDVAAGSDDDDDDKPFFSLVTGTYATAGSSRHTKHMQEEVGDYDGESTALQVRNERGEIVQYRSEAAEFLAKREYRGLEARIGETPAHAAVMGTTGIARGYAHEQ